MRTLNQHQMQPKTAIPTRDLRTIGPVDEPTEQRVAQPEPVAAGAVPALAPNGGTPSAAGSPVAIALAKSESQPAAPPQPANHPMQRLDDGPSSMTLLYIGILLFGFVGTQLAWTLRPFFGSPGEPFALFRHINGTFYADIFSTIGRLFQ
jgi:hypothetical protein